MKPTWCKYIVQGPQLHCGFHLYIFVLKDSNEKRIFIVSRILFQIFGAIYETVSVPYLTVSGFLEQNSL